jgi:hypothetical protein
MRSSASRRRKSIGLPPWRQCEFRCGLSGWKRESEARLWRAFLGTVDQTESRPCCALLNVATPNFKTSECGREMRLFVQRSGRVRCGSGFAGHCTDGIARKRVVCIVQMRVSPDQFLTCSVTASGLLRRPAASSLFCFGYAAFRLRFPSAMDPP